MRIVITRLEVRVVGAILSHAAAVSPDDVGEFQDAFPGNGLSATAADRVKNGGEEQGAVQEGETEEVEHV